MIKRTARVILALVMILYTVLSAVTANGVYESHVSISVKKEEQEVIPEENITPKRGDNTADFQNRHGKEQTKTTNTNHIDWYGYHQCIGTNGQGWYFTHNTEGKQPPMPHEFSYITKYGGYWIDTRHCEMADEDKVIYLTFDAGYENGNVEKVLDILKDENVPAAFFILENVVTKNTDLVKRMIQEGHLVCNHTANHKDMTKMTSFDEFCAEIQEMEKIYTEVTGEKLASYYRPPEGRTSEQTLEWANKLGYKTIFWSYAYADWDNQNQMLPERALRKVLSETHNGEVLLLHPTSATNAAILDDLIVAWKQMGFRFGTLDELTQE